MENNMKQLYSNDKTYVFFTYSIKNVGGSQLYVASKSEYLIKQGWKVIIIYSQDGELLIKKFLNYNTFYYPELACKAYHCASYLRNKITNKLKTLINHCTIIESHASNLSSWAEIVSKQLNAKHIVFNIDEKPCIPPIMYDFYKFKYQRGELAGIVEDSVQRLFEPFDFALDKGSPMIKAYGASDCIFEVEYETPKYENGPVIGFVGRMEKEFICNTAQIMADFIKMHPSITFNVVYVGGQPKGTNFIEQIKRDYADIHNVRLYFTGYLFPIPLKLVESFDFCISGAGAANALTRKGIPTITVDARDLKAMGVLGVTTNQTLFSDTDKQPLEYWIKELMSNKKQYLPHTKENSLYYNLHEEFISKSDKEKAYNISYVDKISIKIICCRIYSIFNFLRS